MSIWCSRSKRRRRVRLRASAAGEGDVEEEEEEEDEEEEVEGWCCGSDGVGVTFANCCTKDMILATLPS